VIVKCIETVFVNRKEDFVARVIRTIALKTAAERSGQRNGFAARFALLHYECTRF
jgi:hypothetical protein